MSSCSPSDNTGAAGKVAAAVVFRLARFGRSSRATGVGVRGRRAGINGTGGESATQSAITRKPPIDGPAGVGEANSIGGGGTGGAMRDGEAADKGGIAEEADATGEEAKDGIEGTPGTGRFRADPLKKPNPLPAFRGVTAK